MGRWLPALSEAPISNSRTSSWADMFRSIGLVLLTLAFASPGTQVVGKLFQGPTEELLKRAYDVIIVGGMLFATKISFSSADAFLSAGAGGGATASRLTEDPRVRVLLIEAGGRSVTCFHLCASRR